MVTLIKIIVELVNVVHQLHALASHITIVGLVDVLTIHTASCVFNKPSETASAWANFVNSTRLLSRLLLFRLGSLLLCKKSLSVLAFSLTLYLLRIVVAGILVT